MPDSRELPGVLHFTFDAPPGETPPPGRRGDLLPVLKSFGDEGAAEDVVLAAGELIANAVEHGGGVVALHVEGRRGDVRVEVYDHEPLLHRLDRSGATTFVVDTDTHPQTLAVLATRAEPLGITLDVRDVLATAHTPLGADLLQGLPG